ncbi:GNAT family N-acetyltransferase [Streptomyces sp. IBSNAI002]|uniref:GNAT family N-acetyltransferase n=1 Tax=Streptomyces sp. IBSNAI002 TaxID=3457500 RepID=UPI003FD1B093
MDAANRASALSNPALFDSERPAVTLRETAPRPLPHRPLQPFSVRFMANEDLPFVVGEHRRHFPDGFFARLGPAFLTSYTRTYLTSPHATGFIAEVDGRPAGFLVGIVDGAPHRRHLLRAHGISLLGRAALGLLARPRLAWQFSRTRLARYYRKLVPGRAPVGAAGPRPAHRVGREAVLSHVAVTPDARSLGIGNELIERFAQFALLADCARISLVTAAGPTGAGPYYEQRGWRRRGETRTPDGLPFVTYERTLLPPWAAPGARRGPAT